MQSETAPSSTVALNDAVDGLTLELFELTSDGLKVESLTGKGEFAGRTGTCCTAGSSTTCIIVSCQAFC